MDITNMALLQMVKASGVTATAHNKEGSTIERELFESGEFRVHTLFKHFPIPEVQDFKEKSYRDL